MELGSVVARPLLTMRANITLVFKKGKKENPCVLVWAGIELISFVEAHVVLSFGFLMKTVLITQGCFSCCRAAPTQSQGLFSSSRCPGSEVPGGARGAERGCSQDPNVFHATWHHAEQ